MKIVAISDLHGSLIPIRDKCDTLVIAGDWSPLYCQHDSIEMMGWIATKFTKWMKKIDADNIVFIPGNHDMICTYSFFEDDLKKILLRSNLLNKVHFLNMNSVTINGIKFYGNPNNESPRGWAFAKQYNQVYKFDNDTDVLITHQPPLVGDVGYVKLYHKEFGSKELQDRIKESNIQLNICGHIHTGSHEEHKLQLNNGKIARIHNVSILDEDYDVAFSPTVIEL